MPTQPDEIWDDIRDELRRETPDFKFHIWIDPLELAAVRGLTVYVRAPEHIRMSVAERYLPLLRRAASVRFNAGATVEIAASVLDELTELFEETDSSQAVDPAPVVDESVGDEEGNEFPSWHAEWSVRTVWPQPAE